MRVVFDYNLLGFMKWARKRLEALNIEVLVVPKIYLHYDTLLVEYAKKNNLILVTQDQKPADLAELLGVKYVLVSRSLIAKIVDAKIREKYGIKKSGRVPSA